MPSGRVYAKWRYAGALIGPDLEESKFENGAFGSGLGIAACGTIMLPENGCTDCKSRHDEMTEATLDYHHVLNQYELAWLKRESDVVRKLHVNRSEARARLDGARSVFRELLSTSHKMSKEMEGYEREYNGTGAGGTRRTISWQRRDSL